MTKGERKISDSYVSPVNWYLASYLLRFRVIGENEDKPNNRYLAWENTIIIKANDPEEAYEKAIEEAKLNAELYKNTNGKMVEFVFEGLTSLLAIYNELEDGAEISWKEYENTDLKTIQGWVKQKEELEVFDKD